MGRVQQAGLWDSFRADPKLEQARQERDRALESVMRVSFVEAVEMVAESLAGRRVTGEDIRAACEERDVLPHHPNAWGAAINSLVRKKRLVFANEYRPMRAKRSHARRTPVYTVHGAG